MTRRGTTSRGGECATGRPPGRATRVPTDARVRARHLYATSARRAAHRGVLELAEQPRAALAQRVQRALRGVEVRAGVAVLHVQPDQHHLPGRSQDPRQVVLPTQKMKSTSGESRCEWGFLSPTYEVPFWIGVRAIQKGANPLFSGLFLTSPTRGTLRNILEFKDPLVSSTFKIEITQ